MGKKSTIIKIYPVGNGDTTLIKLKNGQTILNDCKIRDGEIHPETGNHIFDVKTDLLKNVNNTGNKYELDVFILSHPDEDHCLNFHKHFFYNQKPEKYDKSSQEEELIFIKELWVTSCLLNNASNDSAKELKKEAERRLKLWKENDSSKNDDGNRIRFFGYDHDDKFNNVPNSIPGEILTNNHISGCSDDYFEFFIHAPFKESLIKSTAKEDKNSSSIVIQFAFERSNDDFICKYLTAGDADHFQWERILEKSKKYSNMDRLEWDIFESPHHCSWSFFNNVPYENEENKSPKEYSLDILEQGREDAYVIASSRKVKSSKPNPPHQAAKDEYLEFVKNSHFLNTDTNFSEGNPKPIIFEINESYFERTDEEININLEGASVLASKSIVTGHYAC
ncbi:cobyric acid synthase CobQ [Marivirga sp.]|uniref:cobyric acid synthase CobQ n=1 Tax=Marivirga sp. TaxID=2018662 RepID=UPI002D802C4A|nr:cobyric acid synthase CobQ [Marivirga sp.]HET8861042.1 cobyric acid synthase CobQ [Marivirga sp.]